MPPLRAKPSQSERAAGRHVAVQVEPRRPPHRPRCGRAVMAGHPVSGERIDAVAKPTFSVRDDT
jgi:hypothetical protein